jgi:hypothetical protein
MNVMAMLLILWRFHRFHMALIPPPHLFRSHEHDGWKKDLQLPPKDNRPQTEV